MKSNARWFAALAMILPLCWAGCHSEKNLEQAELHYSVGKDLIDKGDQARGIAELLKAYEANPKDADTNEMLGLIYSEKGMLDKAEFHLREAVKLNNQNPDYRNNLCTVYLKAKRPDSAIPECQGAIGDITYATPERAYNNLGLAYQMKGDAKLAESNFRQALLHNKAFFLAHLNLGKLYFEQGKVKESIESFRQAQQGCENCAEPPYRLGVAYLKNKQSKLAKQAFTKCSELDQNGEAGKECRGFLSKMR